MDLGIIDAAVMRHQQGDVVAGGADVDVEQELFALLAHEALDRLLEPGAGLDVAADRADISLDYGNGCFHRRSSNRFQRAWWLFTCLNIVFCGFWPQQLSGTRTASAPATSPGPSVRRAEVVAEPLERVGADPLQVSTDGRVAVDASAHLQAAIVDRDISEHNLLAR